jgi:DNA ligase-1
MIDEKQMTLGMDWQGQDVAGWYATEKIDGYRAYWDGANFWTRTGNKVNAPSWFTDGLPPVAMDCELYAGIGKRSAITSYLRSGNFPATLRLMVFDVPEASGDYAARMHSLPEKLPAHVQALPVKKVANTDHAFEMMLEIQAQDGEGIVLRNPAVDRYEIGRTQNLLKLK